MEWYGSVVIFQTQAIMFSTAQAHLQVYNRSRSKTPTGEYQLAISISFDPDQQAFNIIDLIN